MLQVQINTKSKKYVESQIVELLQRKEYTLNSVNNYGDNLLHISAGNGCFDITKKLLEQVRASAIKDRKNNFGWTPLMLAIRNRDINTVKLLLENNASINRSTYLGMSVLTLASGINIDMFELVHNACPSALMKASHDDITPLCIAALKNDKKLFFKLLDLGCDVTKENEFTHIIMKQSSVPEIATLAKHQPEIEDYWNDTSDNIEVKTDSNIEIESDQQNIYSMTKAEKSKRVAETLQKVQNIKTDMNDKENVPNQPFTSLPTIAVDPCIESNSNTTLKPNTGSKRPNLKLFLQPSNFENQSLISPTLTYNQDAVFPVSPNMSFVHSKFPFHTNTRPQNIVESQQFLPTKLYNDGRSYSENLDEKCTVVLQRLQSLRPLDLNIENTKDDLDSTLGYTPEFSPTRSPNVPADINEENTYGKDTPTPPRYKTPPRGMVLSTQQSKMIALLKRFGLTHLISIFLEQEVDLDLFLTLTETDLIEIGISEPEDRQALLAMILLCKDMEIQ